MPTNLAIDDKLLAQAQKEGRHKTKRETVNTALQAYLNALRRMKVVEAFGTFDFDPDYDHKQARRRR
jgi:Arc/MetJ family transcription regulator